LDHSATTPLENATQASPSQEEEHIYIDIEQQLEMISAGSKTKTTATSVTTKAGIDDIDGGNEDGNNNQAQQEQHSDRYGATHCNVDENKIAADGDTDPSESNANFCLSSEEEEQ
jgi:hypothetical protein